MKRRIYIAGPMSGIADYNYPAFNKVADQLRALGVYEVENPAENPTPECGTWLGYMRLAIPQLMRCDEVVLLPGWGRSRGARTEYNLAHSLGLQISEWVGGDQAVMQVISFGDSK